MENLASSSCAVFGLLAAASIAEFIGLSHEDDECPWPPPCGIVTTCASHIQATFVYLTNSAPRKESTNMKILCQYRNCNFNYFHMD